MCANVASNEETLLLGRKVLHATVVLFL